MGARGARCANGKESEPLLACFISRWHVGSLIFLHRLAACSRSHVVLQEFAARCSALSDPSRREASS